MRNPWRFSFDSSTNDLYIGDVGQGSYEEIDFQAASSVGGENYGWNIMEGTHCYASTTCDTTGLVLPIVEYDHSLGCSVTGGLAYRGTITSMQGVYFYGDYCSGRIWGLTYDGNSWSNTLLLNSDYTIASFGTDEEERLYLADYWNGRIFEIVEAP